MALDTMNSPYVGSTAEAAASDSKDNATSIMDRSSCDASVATEKWRAIQECTVEWGSIYNPRF